MNILKQTLLFSSLAFLFACTLQPKTDKTVTPVKTGYLKDNISQAELDKRNDYKRYNYRCHNLETGASSHLATYFPLSRESRMKDNFGFYFQLNGGKAEPFDHVENKKLNARGTRFEVVYHSYNLIQGHYVDLIARERTSTYYKNHNSARVPWLRCREG